MIKWLAALYQSFVVTLLWLSVVAAVVALVVMIVRRLLKGRIPHRTLCVLWLLVFLRLFLPVTVETPFSLIPSPITNAVQQNFVTEEPSNEPAAEPDDTPTAVIPETPQVSSAPVVSEPVIDYPQAPTVSAPVTQAPQQTAPVLQPSSTPETEDADPIEDEEEPVLTDVQKKAQLRQAIAAGIWLIGVAAMLVSGAVSYLMLRRRVYDSIRAADGVWEHPELSSPFILGLFRPRIYLPMGIDGQARQFILQHEQAHLRRLDHIVKPVCWLALAFHWFNPFVWGAFQLMGRDIENACDERVLHTLGSEVKADYAATLLALATKKRFPAPSPLSFDEGDAEARIKNVLRFKKPVLWVSIAAVIVVAITAVCLLSNRSPRSLDSFYPQVNWEKVESAKAGFDLTDMGNYGWQVELSDEATAEVIDLLHEYKYWKGLSHLVPDNRIGWLHSVWRLYFEFENGSQITLKYTEDGVLVVIYSSALLPDGAILDSSNIHYSVDGGEELASAMLALIQQEEKEAYTENLRAAMKDTDIYSGGFPALLAQLMPPSVEFSPDDPLTADDYAAIFAQAEWLSGQNWRLDRSGGAAYVHTHYIRLLLSEFLIGCEEIDWDGYTGRRHMNLPNDIVEVLLEQTDQRELLQSSAVENITPYSDTELAVLMDKLGVSYENAEAYDITAQFSYSGYDSVKCTYCILLHDDTFKIVSASCEREDLADEPDNDPAHISKLSGLFLSALNDEVEIIDPGLGMTDTLSELVKAIAPTVEMKITEIAVVDLDGDGIEEVLLFLETPGTGYGTMILRYDSTDGQIYAYELWLRAFMDVKTDGTFTYSGGASVSGIARISFTPEGYEKEYITYSEEDYPDRNIYYYVNKQPAAEQEFQNTFATWQDQPGVTWLEYTSENTDLLLREHFTKVYDPSMLTRTDALPDESAILYADVDGKRILQVGEHIGPISDDVWPVTATGFSVTLTKTDSGSIALRCRNQVTSGLDVSVPVTWSAETGMWVRNGESIDNSSKELPRELVTPDTLPIDPEEYYLVAALPESHVYLYAKNHGEDSLLLWNGNFWWPLKGRTAHTPRMNLPRLYLMDENTQTTTVAAISEIASGTEVSAEQLVVYVMGENKVDSSYYIGMRDAAYDWSSVHEAFNKKNTLVYDADSNSFTVFWNGRVYSSGELPQDMGQWLALEDGYTGSLFANGDITKFTYVGGNRFTVTVKTAVEGRPLSIGETGLDLNWTVEFNGEGFDLVGEVSLGSEAGVNHRPSAAESENGVAELPNGWKLNDFTIAGFDKDGLGDFGYRVVLSEDELKLLPELLNLSEWQELANPPEYGLTVCLALSDADTERFLYVLDGMDGKTVIKLSAQDTGESFVYLVSEECITYAKALAAVLKDGAS